MTDWKAHGKKSRSKGRDYEQALARDARERGYDAFRQLQSQGELSSGADVVIGAERVAGEVKPTTLAEPIHVECKSRKNFSASDTARITKRGLVAAVKVTNVGTFYALPPDLFWSLLERARR